MARPGRDFSDAEIRALTAFEEATSRRASCDRRRRSGARLAPGALAAGRPRLAALCLTEGLRLNNSIRSDYPPRAATGDSMRRRRARLRHVRPGAGPRRQTYVSDRPKHESLTYLVDRRGVLMTWLQSHGAGGEQAAPANQLSWPSGAPSSPRRTASGRCSAVLDRGVSRRLAAQRRSWVTDADGARQGYHFSINAAMLEREPWNDGIICILPRDGFRQERRRAGGTARRVGERDTGAAAGAPAGGARRLSVLRQVQGHDEAALERLESAPGDLFTGFAHLTELADRVRGQLYRGPGMGREADGVRAPATRREPGPAL